MLHKFLAHAADVIAHPLKATGITSAVDSESDKLCKTSESLVSSLRTSLSKKAAIVQAQIPSRTHGVSGHHDGSSHKKPSLHRKFARRCGEIRQRISDFHRRRLEKTNRWPYGLADVYDVPTCSVQYRDIDLGTQREELYADTVAVLLNAEEHASVSDLDSASDWSSFEDAPQKGDDVIYQVIYQDIFKNSVIDNWEKLQYTTGGLPLGFQQKYPLVHFARAPSTASTAVEEDQEQEYESMRPTTSSTQSSSASGRSLRRLQSHSTMSARLSHSRNVSEMSATTVWSNEASDLPVRVLKDERASFLERVEWPKPSEQDQQSTSSMSDEETWEYEDDYHLGAWDHASVVSHVSEDEGCYFTESPKCLSIHHETVDDRGYEASEIPKVIAKSYAKFNDAFTKQLKEYSSLLDELADPDETARALELVNNKRGVYLHSKSGSFTSYGGGSLLQTKSTFEFERRDSKTKSTPEFERWSPSRLNAAAGDEDVETWAGNVKFTALATPLETSVAEIAQFIDDGDSDLDLECVSLVRPTLSRFPAWNRSTCGDIASVEAA